MKEIRHEKNPFLENMWVPIGSKSVTMSPLGKNNDILINQSTGEVHGTHIVARKRVDKEKFVKTFANYMAFTFDLTLSGNKALRVLMWALQEKGRNKDLIMLDKWTHEDFMAKHDSLALSLTSFRRGLTELCKAQIIAKSVRKGHYYINPNCLFNGDRIVFSTVIETQNETNNRIDHKTKDFINGKPDNPNE